jgi:hypothetical protein
VVVLGRSELRHVAYAGRWRRARMQRMTNGLLVALVLVGLGAYVGVQRTEAFVIWCWDDPIVQVDNQTVLIRVGVQGEPADVAQTTAYLNVFVPPGSNARTLAYTNRYLKAEIVTFVESGSQAGQVDISFRDAPSTMQAAVEISTNGIKTTGFGTTKSGVNAQFAQ